MKSEFKVKNEYFESVTKTKVNLKEGDILLLEEENRIIDVRWYDENKQSSYTVDIEIFANDRTGLLADIIKLINVSFFFYFLFFRFDLF